MRTDREREWESLCEGVPAFNLFFSTGSDSKAPSVNNWTELITFGHWRVMRGSSELAKGWGGDRTDCTCHDDDDVGQAATTTTVAAAAGLAAFVSTFDSKTLNWQKGRLWKICFFNRLTVIYFAKSFFGQFAAKYFGNDFLQKIVVSPSQLSKFRKFFWPFLFAHFSAPPVPSFSSFVRA